MVSQRLLLSRALVALEASLVVADLVAQAQVLLALLVLPEDNV